MHSPPCSCFITLSKESVEKTAPDLKRSDSKWTQVSDTLLLQRSALVDTPVRRLTLCQYSDTLVLATLPTCHSILEQTCITYCLLLEMSWKVQF